MKCRRSFLAGLAVAAFASLVPAADKVYPRVNLAVSYVVDPAWPQRPGDMKWGAVSGVAVDAKDQIYVFTRGYQPVQVYDNDGKFVRAWGKDVIKSSHHIRIDPEGNVWTADIVDHTIRKFTPEGKLLMTLGT